MVVHTFELINGDWTHTGFNAVCSRTIKEELEHNNLLEGIEVHATVNDKTLTFMYNDNHLKTQAAKREIQVLTAKIAHIYVVTHADVKRKGANIVRFRYTFERTA